MPILGIIFLRHATNRYNAVLERIAGEKASGKLPKGLPITKAHFVSRRAEIVEQLMATAYFECQAHWLVSRFPDAKSWLRVSPAWSVVPVISLLTTTMAESELTFSDRANTP